MEIFFTDCIWRIYPSIQTSLSQVNPSQSVIRYSTPLAGYFQFKNKPAEFYYRSAYLAIRRKHLQNWKIQDDSYACLQERMFYKHQFSFIKDHGCILLDSHNKLLMTRSSLSFILISYCQEHRLGLVIVYLTLKTQELMQIQFI